MKPPVELVVLGGLCKCSRPTVSAEVVVLPVISLRVSGDTWEAWPGKKSCKSGCNGLSNSCPA